MDDSSPRLEARADADGLLARAQRGEPAAFERFYRDYSPSVYSLGLWMLGSEAEAKELTEEAFSGAFREVGSFGDEAAFTNGLWHTTVTLTVTRLMEGPPPERFLEELPPRDEAARLRGAERPLQRLDRDIGRIHLEQAIGQLQPGHRIVFLLHDVFGHSHDKIATFLGCSSQDSKIRLLQARLRLRTLLCGADRTHPASAVIGLRPVEQAR